MLITAKNIEGRAETAGTSPPQAANTPSRKRAEGLRPQNGAALAGASLFYRSVVQVVGRVLCCVAAALIRRLIRGLIRGLIRRLSQPPPQLAAVAKPDLPQRALEGQTRWPRSLPVFHEDSVRVGTARVWLDAADRASGFRPTAGSTAQDAAAAGGPSPGHRNDARPSCRLAVAADQAGQGPHGEQAVKAAKRDLQTFEHTGDHVFSTTKAVKSHSAPPLRRASQNL